jgi:hypothetical protein
MVEPRVVTILREYREMIEARETAILEDMTRHWLMIEKRLSGDIAALELLMAQKAKDGMAITEQMVWKDERYQILKGNLEQAIKEYNRDYLIETVTKGQGDFGWLGVQAAAAAIKASYIYGNIPYFPVLNRDAIIAMSGFLGNGAPLNSLLKNDYPDALQGLMNALINGIARGSSFGQVAREMAEGMGMGLERAMLIARSEFGRAYRSANIKQYRESHVVTGFYRLVKKGSACMGCLLLDGERFSLEKELDDHPRGNCQAVADVMGVGAPNWEKGSDWFENLGEDQQRE